MSIVARFYPNGEFTQGVDTVSQRRDKRRDKPTQRLDQECRDRYLQWVNAEMENGNADINLCIPGYEFKGKTGALFTFLCEDEQGYHYAIEGVDYVLPDVVIKEPPGRLVGNGDLIPVGLSNARILTKPQSGRKKCLSMSKNMARNIRNAAYLLEWEYGKDNLSFLTLTIPDLDDEDMVNVCKNWDKLVHKFLKWLRTKIEAQGFPFKYVYCTEIQLKRLQKYGKYAPHLHLLFRGKYGKKSPWAITPSMARKEWVRCLQSVCRGSFKQSALENLQRVRKSAGGYLSKYLSKTSNCLPSESEDAPIQRLLTHWGGMSRNLSQQISTGTTIVRGDGATRDIATILVRGFPLLLRRGVLRYWKQGYIQLFYNGDDRDTRYLRVSSGCLIKPKFEGGLEILLEELNAMLRLAITEFSTEIL